MLGHLCRPRGHRAFAIALTDGPNGTGNQLSQSITSEIIGANVMNAVTLTANPVVAKVAVEIGAIPSATSSVPAGSVADIPVTVNAYDADNNLIVGPGAYVDANGNAVSFTLAVNDARAGGSGTTQLQGPTSINAPVASTTTLHYDGNWLDHTSVTVSSSSPAITTGNLHAATLTETPHAKMFSGGISANAGLYGIASGPDGNLWFTEYNQNRIAKISTSGVVSEFPAGLGGINTPQEITANSDGLMYFTDHDGFAGKISTSGTVSLYGVLHNGFHTGIFAPVPDSNIWFADGSGTITKMSSTGSSTSYGTTGNHPNGVIYGPDGNMWVTYEFTSQISRYSLTGAETDFTYPDAHTGGFPSELAIGSDQNIWFIDSGGYYIGRCTPSGTVTLFSAGITNNAGIQHLVEAPDGNIWFVESSTGLLGRITPSGTVTEFGVANGLLASGSLIGLAVGPAGNLWFTDAANNAIGEFVL